MAGAGAVPTLHRSDYEPQRLLEGGRTYLIKNKDTTAQSPKHLLSPWHACVSPLPGVAGELQKYLPVGDPYWGFSRGTGSFGVFATCRCSPSSSISPLPCQSRWLNTKINK